MFVKIIIIGDSMDNELFLNQYKNIYNSLTYFSFKGNILVLEYNNTILETPLNYTSLSNLNNSVFMQNPIDIFNIIHMLELLYKKELNDTEVQFITNYIKAYLDLNDLALEGQNDQQERLWCLSIPVYSSYDPKVYANPGAQIIQNETTNHIEDRQSGKSNSNVQKLVLSNPNMPSTYDDTLHSFEKAGFTTILLIAGTIAATCIYIAYFIVGA